ncbi:aspartate kinase [Apibacter sp. HY039]|uniref:aspartate kinase n=1 Tax=Apibacter sp. HY039 TaxID=2501476 RepID=UPI000FEBAA9B|nr:aspartate kinase [Apibacter sp. HY039]
MKVYKFGGASVKDAENVRNAVKVLLTAGYENTVVVVSAMGKTTNALEEAVKQYFDSKDYLTQIQVVENNHLDICRELFESSHPIFKEIQLFFSDIISFLRKNKSPNYNFVYDQVVSCGELISTKIISAFLNFSGMPAVWLDIRDYIKSDSTYREARVDWEFTLKQFESLDFSGLYITQGFIAADPNYFTTTLGREGSDYTAAILAYCLNAESMTIWKDVPGVMNADPRLFKEACLLNSLSYEEAIELAFYGASVIHPKTLQPLRRKEIPFFVRSFMEPEKPGTSIKKGVAIDPLVPCYIVKNQQHIVNISSKDFSFMQEENLSYIFARLSALNIKVNMISVSAISVCLCIEDKFLTLDQLVDNLKEFFTLAVTRNVTLYTIRHSDADINNNFIKGKVILSEQIVKDTYQVVVKE